MENKTKKKKDPWRIIVFVISVAVIIFLWVKKDIAEIYQTMPAEQILPLVVTTVFVSFLKVAAIAAVIFLVKFILSKSRKK